MSTVHFLFLKRFLLSFAALIFLFHSFPSAAYSESSSTSFCKEWYSSENAEKKNKPKNNLLKLVLQTFQLKFRPHLFSEPHPIEFSSIQSEQLTTSLKPSSESKADPEGKNILLYLGAPQKLLEAMSVKIAKKRVKQARRLAFSQLRRVRKLTKTSTLENCLETEKRMGFTLNDYQLALAELENTKIESQVIQEKRNKKILADALKASPLEWEVVEATDLNAAFQAIQDPRLKRLVLVSHATEDGVLIDSQWNEYPNTFFDAIQPSVDALAVYSCSSSKVKSRYPFETLFQGFSEPKKRKWIGVKRRGSEDERQLAPLQGFPYFLKNAFNTDKFAQKVSAQSEVISRESKMDSSVCEIRLKSPKIVQGTFGFFLNLHFIGTIGSQDQAQDAVPLKFPCRFYLSDRANIITNRNVSSLELTSSTVGVPFEISFDSRGTGKWQAKHFYRRDETYQSSVWKN